MELILWDKKALAVNFDNSELQMLVFMIFSSSTQFWYIFDKASIAKSSSPPIKILSGFCKSLIADPSAKNSGLETTKNLFSFTMFFEDSFNIFLIVSAVLTGKVLFSITIVSPFANWDTCLVEASIHFRSLAFPAPIPFVFVGVLTEEKSYLL